MSQQKSEIFVRAPCSPFTFLFSFLEGGLALSYATQELASHVVPRALALLQQHLLFLTIPIFLLGDDSKEEQLCIIVLRCRRRHRRHASISSSSSAFARRPGALPRRTFVLFWRCCIDRTALLLLKESEREIKRFPRGRIRRQREREPRFLRRRLPFPNLPSSSFLLHKLTDLRRRGGPWLRKQQHRQQEQAHAE